MFPSIPPKKQESLVTGNERSADGDAVRQYRIETFRDELRFTQKEAELLADAKMSGGRPLDWHFVKRALNNGLNHRKAVDLLT